MKRRAISIGIILLYCVFCPSEIESETIGTKFKDPLWKGKNTCVYDLVKNEANVGLASFEISKGKLNDKEAYFIKMSIAAGVTTQIAKVAVRTEDLKPLRSEITTISPQGEVDVRADYSTNNKVTLIGKTAKAPSQKMILSLPEDAYGNEEILMLLRALPFKPGLRMQFSNFSPAVGRIYPSAVKVLKEETVSAPAGDFECFKVESKIMVGNIIHYVWYAKAPPHYLVMYDNKEIVFKLREILQDGKKVEF